MVGLADLKRYTDNLKVCQMNVNNKYCYFYLSGLTTFDFLDILNYKSWVYKTYQRSVTVRYVNLIKKLEKGNAIVRTSIGFGPLLLRFLRIKGYQIRDQDIEAYRSRLVVYPDLKISLYDFQQRMVNDWLNVGGIGVVKSPTGSGKTIVGCRAIKDIGRKTLILVHTSDLLINVWNDSLIKTFGNGVMSQVGIIGGGLTDADRMAMKIGARTNDFEENVKKDIVIATFQTLNNRLDELSQYKFGLMIVDECIPIDSEIWTNDGILKYEDLGYGSEYKRDIFQVWSRDNGDYIVNNGYKKVKTRMKRMYRTIVETGDELVCSLDHKVLTKKDDGKEEFVEIDKAKNIARSLIKPYDMRKECILARTFGYILGDGWVDINRNSGAGGDYEGLVRLQNDLKRLNYHSSIGEERKLESIIDSISSGKLSVHGSVYTVKFDKRFSELLIKLGHPIGRKPNHVYYLPDWIMNGNIEIKKEFIAGYLGAESNNPGFRGDEENKLKKSFYVPRFSITKRTDLITNGLELAGQFKQLLKDINVEVSDISSIDGNIRKDGTISKKIIITISNQVDNLRRYLDIGYRYCYEKEKEGNIIRLYLGYIDQCNKERYDIQDQIRRLYDKGVGRMDRIVAIINSRTYEQKNIMSAWGAEVEDDKIINKKCLVIVTDGMVSDILHPHKRDDGTDIIAKTVKIKKDMYSFDDWRNKVMGDFIFLDILRHEYRGYEQGYTLTVGKDHNYLVNGYVLRNCHHVPAQMFRKVNAAIRAPYKMGLSATTKRLDGLEKDVFSSLGDIQTSVSIRELINKGILAEPRFQSPVIIDHGAIEAIENCGHAGLIFSRFVKKTSASSTKKKDYIVNICKNVAARNRKFLLFTDYVHAEDVYVRDMFADALLAEGIRVSIIDQGMSTDERSAVFGFLESGEISGIVFGKLGSEGVNIPSVDVVIMANAIKCISGDILIPTEKGIIRAEDLNKVRPNIASTMNLEDRSIVKAEINELYNFDEEKTIRIRTGYGYEIEGSLNHMIIVKDIRGNLVYKPLSEVRIGDIVLIIGSNMYGKDVDINYDMFNPRKNRSDTAFDRYAIEIIDRINNSNLIEENKEKYIKISHDELTNIVNEKIDIDPYLLSRKIKKAFFNRGLSFPTPRYDYKKCKWYYIVKILKRGYRKDYIDSDIWIPSRMNQELAELLGYFVSEGYVSTKIKDWRATLSNSNEFLIDRMKYLFKSLFDYDINIYKYKNGNILLQCTRKNIVRFLASIGLEHMASEKVVPDCILRSSKNVQVEFLRALFSGDGSACKNGSIRYTSTSKVLCKEIHIMLLNMGIISKYDNYENQIHIYSYEVDNFIETIGFSDERKVYIPNFRRDMYSNSKTYTGEKGKNVILFDNVVHKKESKNKLYDMNIGKYHSFIAGGFINHNSPITFTQRVGRVMRKVPGKDFCDVYEILLDVPTEYKWSEYNFLEYKLEGFQKLVYKVE